MRIAIVIAAVLVAARADADTPAQMFAAAEQLFKDGKLDDAARVYATIVTKYPKDPEAGPSGERMLVIASQVSNYAALWELAQRLASVPAFASRGQQLRLETIRFQASSKLGDVEANDEHFSKAADFYQRAAGETPDARAASQAMTNAGVMFEKARLLDRAIETYRAVAEKWPTEPTAPKSLFVVARLDEVALQWERAADAYEQVAVKYPADLTAADALYNSGVLRAALGETQPAIERLDRYTSKYKARADVPATAVFVAKLREDSGDLTGAFAGYVGVAIGMPGATTNLEARVGAGRVAYKLGRDRDAERHITAAIELGKQARERNKRLTAEAWLWRARLMARKAEAVSIAVPASQLKTAIVKKRELWDQAERVLLEIISMDATIGVTALRDAAENRERLLKAIESQPQLQPFAGEARNRVIDLYTATYAKLLQLQIYGADIVAIHDALVRYGVAKPDPFAYSAPRSDSAPMPALLIRDPSAP